MALKKGTKASFELPFKQVFLTHFSTDSGGTQYIRHLVCTLHSSMYFVVTRSFVSPCYISRLFGIFCLTVELQFQSHYRD